MEELLKQIIARLDGIEKDVLSIKSDMATKADIARIEARIEKYGEVQQKDIYHLLKLTSERWILSMRT